MSDLLWKKLKTVCVHIAQMNSKENTSVQIVETEKKKTKQNASVAVESKKINLEKLFWFVTGVIKTKEWRSLIVVATASCPLNYGNKCAKNATKLNPNREVLCVLNVNNKKYWKVKRHANDVKSWFSFRTKTTVTTALIFVDVREPRSQMMLRNVYFVQKTEMTIRKRKHLTIHWKTVVFLIRVPKVILRSHRRRQKYCAPGVARTWRWSLKNYIKETTQLSNVNNVNWALKSIR